MAYTVCGVLGIQGFERGLHTRVFVSFILREVYLGR